jgi:hypothetical protein
MNAYITRRATTEEIARMGETNLRNYHRAATLPVGANYGDYGIGIVVIEPDGRIHLWEYQPDTPTFVAILDPRCK